MSKGIEIKERGKESNPEITMIKPLMTSAMAVIIKPKAVAQTPIKGPNIKIKLKKNRTPKSTKLFKKELRVVISFIEASERN